MSLPLKNITNLSNLEEIIIEEPNLCTLELIKFYITTYSKLRRLEFNCFNEFNPNCIKLLRENLPNIEYLSYGANYHLALRTISEKENFREQIRQKNTYHMNAQQTM